MEAKTGLEPSVPSAQVVSLQEVSEAGKGPQLLMGNLAVVADVKVKVEVLVGGSELSIGELFALQAGAVLELDQLRDAPLAVRLDGKTIASGTLVVVGDRFGVRIAEVLSATEVAAQ